MDAIAIEQLQVIPSEGQAQRWRRAGRNPRDTITQGAHEFEKMDFDKPMIYIWLWNLDSIEKYGQLEFLENKLT